MKRIIVLVIVIAIIVLVTSFLMMYKNNNLRNNYNTNNEPIVQNNIVENEVNENNIVENNTEITEIIPSGEEEIPEEKESKEDIYYSYVYDDSLEDGCYALSITLKKDNIFTLSNGKGISFYGEYKQQNNDLLLIIKSVGSESFENDGEIAQIRFSKINDNTLEISDFSTTTADGLNDVFVGMIFEKDIIL